VAVFWLLDNHPNNPVAESRNVAANDSPSPGGEGRNEGERQTHSFTVRANTALKAAPEPRMFAFH